MSDYGSAAGVAVLTRKYTNAGSFDATTKPTATQVGTILDQVCSALDVYLAGAGFVVPITNADVKEMLDGIANSFAADMVHAANSAGRFYTDERLRARSPFSVISLELGRWVKENAAGMEAAGATRTGSEGVWVGSRKTDESGSDINPIFKRDDYGNPGWD